MFDTLQRKATAASIILKEGGPRLLIRTVIDRCLRNGPARPDESQIVFRLIEDKRGCMIDVGAHFGSALAPFARTGWNIYAFEPDPDNRRKLEAEFGPLPNVHIDPRGVSEEPGNDVPFFTSPVSTGISGLSGFHTSHRPHGTVDVTTLDLFCTERNLDRVDFLKIDTEGFDLFVLKGFPWKRLAPPVVLCEFEDFKTQLLGYSFNDLARFLETRNYEIVVSEWHPVRRYGTLHDWKRFVHYPCVLDEPRAWGNLIAVRSHLLTDLIRLCSEFGGIDGKRKTLDV